MNNKIAFPVSRGSEGERSPIPVCLVLCDQPHVLRDAAVLEECGQAVMLCQAQVAHCLSQRDRLRRQGWGVETTTTTTHNNSWCCACSLGQHRAQHIHKQTILHKQHSTCTPK